MSGLYVNTNVNSMTAQANLTSNMSSLSEVLTRLSTGLRINSAKDDPAGLIAGELLRSQITSSTSALSNTKRANGMIGLADSALGQVGDLLNDVRGLVNEAANTGAMSSEQIAANQLQVDASLDAIDRISQTTEYMGQKLLDGSLAFQTSGLDKSQLSNLQIYSANFGTNDKLGIKIDVLEASTSASQVYKQDALGSDGAVIKLTGNQGSKTFTFGANTTTVDMAETINSASDATGIRAVTGSEAMAGIIDITSAGTDNDIILEAKQAGKDAGDYSVKYTTGNTDGIGYTITKGVGDCPDTVDFQLQMEEAKHASASVNEGQLGVFSKDAAGVLFTSTTGSNVKELVIVQDSAATADTAVFDKTTGMMTVTGNALVAADIIAAVNLVTDSTGITAATGTSAAVTAPTIDGTSINTATIDARANNGITVTALTGNEKYNNTDVVLLNGTSSGVANTTFKYVDKAQQSSAVAAVGANFLQVKATQAGAAFNGYTFTFAATLGVTDPATTVSIDSTNKIIAIDTATAGITYAQLQSAIGSVKDADDNSLFSAEFYTADPTGLTTEPPKITDYSGTVTLPAADMITGTTADTVGTDHAALIVNVAAEGTTTAQNVIDEFNDTASLTSGVTEEMRARFKLTPTEGSDGSGEVFETGDDTAGITNFSFSGAMQGGQSGNTVKTTAKELVDFINNDTTIKELFNASLAANSQSGSGKLTLFDEVAFYGCPYDGTGLQFLGPDASKNIEFSTTDSIGNVVKNQELGITWSADTLGYSEASLPATNANASISIKANSQGGEYDDMVVRFKRVTGPEAASSVTYTEGPSNAMAYCDISTTAGDVNGKFILYAKDGGENYNNMKIQANIDTHLSTDAAFSYDENTNTFTITAKNTTIDLEQMMDAFNLSSLSSQFGMELDYSDTDLNGGAPLVNDATTTFASLFGTTPEGNGATTVIGNTGTTGGHTGGVLEVSLYDDTFDSTTYDGTTVGGGLGLSADAVVDLINNSDFASIFTANNYPGSDGTGYIMAREDTVGPAADPANCNGTVNAPRMITSGGIVEEGKMIVNLATDANGNSITTAGDLVAFFDTLSAEETHGVSVSLINPGGDPGTVCDTDGGNGILQPTSYIDNCDNIIDNDIVFDSSCAVESDTTPLSEIVAVNGKDAGFTLFGKNAGKDLEDVTLKYQAITDSSDPSVTYDAATKTITVNIKENTTSAADVRDLIASTAATKDLFEIQLRGTGLGKVTTTDNTVKLKDGTYLAGAKGGAEMLWNMDDTSNEMFLESIDTGSKQFVQIEVISGTFNTVDSATGQVQSRSYGTDTVATANGQEMQSDGRNISLSTTDLAFSASVSEDAQSGDQYTFDIVSGGATFQLGPDVVSTQQIRIGIPSVSTTDLGGISGKMYELRSGGRADLSTNTVLADRIVQEAITAVSSTRGRLGALQKSTLETNIVTLENSIKALTAARADIMDADFATESSNLTKYQILVQSGSNVLGIANQLPQYAASLIG